MSTINKTVFAGTGIDINQALETDVIALQQNLEDYLDGSFNILENLIGKSTNSATDPTLFGQVKAVNTAVGKSTDTATVSTLFGQVNTVNKAVGKSTDKATDTTLFGQVNTVNTAVGNKDDTAKTSMFGLMKSIATNGDTNLYLNIALSVIGVTLIGLTAANLAQSKKNNKK